MNNKKNNYVAILAGGIGSRFWPQSRQHCPKQFLDILGTGKTLIQETIFRYEALVPIENIFIITSEQYVELVKNQLPQIPHSNILAEPSRKNTAPCIAYFAFKIYQINPQAIITIAPSDHIIYNQEAYTAILIKAFDYLVSNHVILTLGIKPTYPNTGYGYIQKVDSKENNMIYKVKTFTEKPNLELAKTFLKTGEFLWNSGIFFWQASTIIEAFKQYQPNIYEIFDEQKHLFNTSEEYKALQHIFPLCPNIAIDIAILEKATNVYVLEANFGWNDLGTWNSIYDNTEKDYLENAVTSKDNVIVIDATKSIICTQKEKLVIVQGLDEYIVVDTPDVLLICKRENEQNIKDYVSEVNKSKRTKFL
ncbi:MAG: mannose-1-phosphate guanylyltransferase [Alphaproteobacteria bacterium]|nr:mannose-1-phosphate guanylyltransferase [Alphaproteobacteria bacterium]